MISRPIDARDRDPGAKKTSSEHHDRRAERKLVTARENHHRSAFEGSKVGHGLAGSHWRPGGQRSSVIRINGKNASLAGHAQEMRRNKDLEEWKKP